MSPVIEQTLRIQLRVRDLDVLGHVNHSVYMDLLTEGRAALLRELVRRVGDDASHGGFVLAHIDLDYHHEVGREEREVLVVVRLARLGFSSLHLEHEIRTLDGRVAASGSSVLVAWDRSSRTKRALTGAERTALS